MSAKQIPAAVTDSCRRAKAPVPTDFASSVKQQVRCIFRELAQSVAKSSGDGQRGSLDQASFIVVDGVRYRRVGDSALVDPSSDPPMAMGTTV